MLSQRKPWNRLGDGEFRLDLPRETLGSDRQSQVPPRAARLERRGRRNASSTSRRIRQSCRRIKCIHALLSHHEDAGIMGQFSMRQWSGLAQGAIAGQARDPPLMRTAWWRRQSGETGLRCPNSLLTGKRTGNFDESGVLAHFSSPILHLIQWLVRKFPKNQNRESIEDYRESVPRYRPEQGKDRSEDAAPARIGLSWRLSGPQPGKGEGRGKSPQEANQCPAERTLASPAVR
jgi:hypothetical protein